MIDNLQTVIGRTVEVAQTNYDGLLGGLNYNLEVLKNNREALAEQLNLPAEPAPAYEPTEFKKPEPEQEEEIIPEEEEVEEVPAEDVEDDDDYEDID